MYGTISGDGCRSDSMEMSGWRWLSNSSTWLYLACVARVGSDVRNWWWPGRGVDEYRVRCGERTVAGLSTAIMVMRTDRARRGRTVGASPSESGRLTGTIAVVVVDTRSFVLCALRKERVDARCGHDRSSTRWDCDAHERNIPCLGVGRFGVTVWRRR